MTDADTLGSELRAAREGRDLTLEQAEKQTRIRTHYLEALEQGNYSALPSAVQGRGFLRNYARFLGLDAEVLVARFDAALRGGARRGGRRQPPVFADDPTLHSASRRTATNPPPRSGRVRSTQPMPASTGQATLPPERMETVAPTPAQERRRRSRNMMLGTLLIIAASIAALIGLLVYSSQQPSPTGTSPILNAGPTEGTLAPTLAVTETPVRTSPTPLPNPNGSATMVTLKSTGGLTIQITVRERAYLRVMVDDAVVYGGAPRPDTVLQYQAKQSIKIRSGDAGGIDVVLNGVPQEALGQRHEIVDKTYSLADLSGAPRPQAPAATGTSVSSASSPTAAPSKAISPTNPLPTLTDVAQSQSSAPTPTAAITAAIKQPAKPTFTQAAAQPSQPILTTPPSATRVPSTAPSPTNPPAATRAPSQTLTPSLTPTASRTPVYLPHETLTPDSRAN